MSDKSSESRVSASVEAQALVRRIAGPGEAGESVKAAMRRACRRLGWTFNRVKDVWHADTRIRVRAEELDQLRAAAARREEEAGKNELAELRARLDRIERLLVSTVADAHGAAVDGVRRQISRLG